MRKRIKELLDLETLPERQLLRESQRLVWRVKRSTHRMFSDVSKNSTGDSRSDKPLEPTG